MAKIVFNHGDYVKARKWSGHTFLGIYEHTYDDGSHCVLDAESGKRFNSHPHDVKMASDEEIEQIKTLIKNNKNIEVNKKPQETPKEDLEALLEAAE
jgi:hypothetical protein